MQIHKVVDYFPFFAKLDKEKLELRYHMLKDHVDFFVVSEANRSHSGELVELELRKTLDELGIPQDRFVIVDVDIPNDVADLVQDIDYQNCYEGNNVNVNSVHARCRERLTKDALLDVIDRFDDDTVFIHSDSDEIIDTSHIKWVSNLARNYEKTHVIKIPLVYLQGKSTFRVHYRHDNSPQMWDKSMFFCTKHHLRHATPTNIRSNVNNPFIITYAQVDGVRVEDMGWHFSCMGDSSKRVIKMENFTHYDDKLSGVIGDGYNSETMSMHIVSEPVLGGIPPGGDKGCVLMEYNSDFLPKEIFLNSRLTDFFIGEKTVSTLRLKSKIIDYCANTSDHIAMFDLAREYEFLGQTATAVSFYLRSAEFTSDDVLSYECLLRIGLCFEQQKNRDYSVVGRYYHAAALCPTRPEAYYCLANHNFSKNNWVDALMFINLCIKMCESTDIILATFRNTWSIFEFKYLRAVCLYEMGNIVESKTQFDDLQRENTPDDIMEKIIYFRKTRSYL